jgi:hypothetical protein
MAGELREIERHGVRYLVSDALVMQHRGGRRRGWVKLWRADSGEAPAGLAAAVLMFAGIEPAVQH